MAFKTGSSPFPLFLAIAMVGPWSCQSFATFALETAPKETKSFLQLQLQQSLYFGETQSSSQTGAYSSLGFRYQHQAGHWGIDAMALGTVDGTQQAYVALPELYWQKRSDRSALIIGRSRMEWSAFDREWRLGIWSPYVRWDYIHPREQGLTGVFYSLSDELSRLTLFASSVFLPDQGPDFQVRNGVFESSNRWFRQPVSRATILDRERRLFYRLEQPSIAQLMQHQSLGAQAEFGDRAEGVWFRASWASKPINQIQVGIDGFLSVSPTVNPGDSVAVVHPLVSRHELMTIEAGWSGDEVRSWLSFTDERTQMQSLQEGWADSTSPSARFGGLAMSHRLPWSGFRRHWVKYAYMIRWEQERQILSEGAGVIDSSLSRYPFVEIASFEWSAPILFNGVPRLDVGLRYLYSIPEAGGLLSATLQYRAERNLRFDVGMDILGSNRTASDPRAGLMTLYQQNDRLMGAMTYVF